MQIKKPDAQNWVEVVAKLASFIGIAGIIALMAHGTWAAPPASPKGFQPGPRTFTNPFVNPQGAAPPKAPSTDDEEEDFESDNAPPANPGARSAPGATTDQNANPGAPISMGGTPPGGVISNNKQPIEHVDSETGQGSKEVVTDFNFPDADILDIANALGKLTGKNFILDKDVKGKITIISNSAITVGDAWKAFLTALDINGFALIPSGKYIRIARQRDARDKQLKTYTGDFAPDTDAYITRVFALKYISADEVARVFRNFTAPNSRVIPYESTNTVIVTDTGANIVKLAKMLEILDIEGYDAGIEVIPVKYASAAEIAKLIDTLLPGTQQTTTPGSPPRVSSGGKFNARRTKEGGIINTILSDDRTNTLIVHANTKGADQVRELVAKLDQKQPFTTGGGKVHVVYLQFADAETIANTLNTLSSTATKPPTATTPGGGTGVNPISTTLFEGNIKVAPDKATNALVVTASPTDYATLQQVINRLDVPRDEVFVEVVVMEVSLNKDFELSTNVVSPSSFAGSVTSGDLFSFIANPLGNGQPSGLTLGFPAGKQITLPNPSGGPPLVASSVMGLVKALQVNSIGSVLATPQIIALDNSEASFDSTQKIQFPTQTAVQGVIQSSFSPLNVTLSIKITPSINKYTNFVKLKVNTKIGDVVPGATLANAPPNTLERTADTTVSVGDSDTVVLGGLIRDKITDKVTKVPILGDIPLLGFLFRATSTQTEKSNLLIFLTPHIVKQYEKVRAILDRKLKERDDFIEKNAGGEDYYRDYRNDIIRNLPDIHELGKKWPSARTEDEPEIQPSPRPAVPVDNTAPTAPAAQPHEPQVAPSP